MGTLQRENLAALRPSLEETGDKLPLLIFVNKGIEISTRALTLEIIADTCGSDIAKVATFIVSLTVLVGRNPPLSDYTNQSGPSFANESKEGAYSYDSSILS